MKAEIEQFAQTNQPESDCKCCFISKRRILSSDCSVHNQQQTKTNKMNNEFIPYEQALALKELGFDEPCFTSYDDEKRLRNLFDYKNSDYYLSAPYIEDSRHWIFNSELTIENFIGNKDLYTQFIAAPLYQQAFRWFRENYNLRGQIISDYDKFSYQIYSKFDNEYHLIKGGSCDQEYEEAELACLKELIEIVKNLNQNKDE